MNLPLAQRMLSAETLSPADAQALLGTAQALRRAAEGGMEQRLLRGKNIAVLCSDPGCESASAFETAARALGARVSRIAPDAAEAAPLLGKLYDAVECDEMPAPVVARLQRELGVPVFNGPARAGHPLGKLAACEDDRTYLLQALLVNTLA